MLPTHEEKLTVPPDIDDDLHIHVAEKSLFALARGCQLPAVEASVPLYTAVYLFESAASREDILPGGAISPDEPVTGFEVLDDAPDELRVLPGNAVAVYHNSRQN